MMSDQAKNTSEQCANGGKIIFKYMKNYLISVRYKICYFQICSKEFENVL